MPHVREMLRRMIEAVEDYAIFRLDARGRVASWNAGARKLTGYSAEEIIGQPYDRFFPAEEAAQGVPGRLLYEAAAHGRVAHEGWRRHKDGSRFWASAVLTPVFSENGALEGYLKIVRDHTQGRKTQLELQRKNEELARSNAELAQFASIASHDLREPLHKAAAFADLLAKRLGPALDAEGADMLARMLGSIDWMRRLIEDLLALSRVTTSQRPFEPVDLAEIARLAVEDLEDLATRTGGRVLLGPLPKTRGDPTQLRQLLVNLIGNALKFRDKAAPSTVVVWGRAAADGFVQFVVADNGIGFEPQFAERILKPFQRLHSRVEYDGTGIGLAICASVALRHGGALEARGAPGKGAAFTVTLPAPSRSNGNGIIQQPPKGVAERQVGYSRGNKST